MSLICSLLRHKVDPASARWNRHVCFGKCMRCGCDVVRSGDAPWQVPRGYRVVWRAMKEPEPVPPRRLSCLEPQVAEPVASGQAEAPEAALVDQAATSAEEQPRDELGGGEAEAGGVFDWPLFVSPKGEIEISEERAAEPAAVGERPRIEEPCSVVPDFMDVQEDGPDWDDFPIRSAVHA